MRRKLWRPASKTSSVCSPCSLIACRTFAIRLSNSCWAFMTSPWPRERRGSDRSNRSSSSSPLLHPYIRFVADCHRGDHCYVTPISRTCWNEDHLHPIPNYEDQGETVPSSERTELKVQ